MSQRYTIQQGVKLQCHS